MIGVCITYGEMMIIELYLETTEERDHLENLDVEWRITLKWILNK
jgi:hypothetical protein